MRKTSMKWMETLPQCDFVSFVLWMVTEDREKNKEERKSYTASKEMEDTYMATELPKTSKQAWKILSVKALHTMETYGKIVCKSVFFFKAPHRGDVSRNCCYLYIHALLFQSMTNGWKSLLKGGVDLVPPLFLPPLTPHLPSALFPRILDFKSAPKPGLPWTEPQSSRVGRARTCL